MSDLIFGEPNVNLVHTEVRVGFKDWPRPVGIIQQWAGRESEFYYPGTEFHCLLSAKQLREIADKMDKIERETESRMDEMPGVA